MPYVCITVDLDRDANIPVPGTPAAGSADRGSGTSPRFYSAGRGLKLLSELFDELNVPATFFAEAETLLELKDSAGLLSGFEVGSHGYAHEDLTLMDENSAEETIVRAAETVADVAGCRPRSFRAPYMNVPDHLADLLERAGFSADSSLYSDGGSCLPYSIGRLTEVPVCRTADGRTSYLWPMHEGRRSAGSYLELADTVGGDGTFVLCDHCWHIVEHCDGRPKDSSEIDESVSRVRMVICSLLDAGFIPRTVHQCASAK